MVFGVKNLFLLLVFIHAASHGQRQLSITPAAGMSFPLSYSIDRTGDDIGYRAQVFTFFPSFVADLQYQHDKNWIFFGGWHAGDNTGFHLRYGDSKRDLREGRLSIGAYTSRLQVGAIDHVSTHKWVKLKKRATILGRTTVPPGDEMLYLLLFRLRILAGGSFNYLVPSTDEGELEGFSSGTFVFSVKDRYSYSAFIGLNLQFFNYFRNHFQLSFIYSQGLSEVITANIDYQLMSGQYETTIGSRGSYFIIQLGYPIKVIDFAKRRIRKM